MPTLLLHSSNEPRPETNILGSYIYRDVMRRTVSFVSLGCINDKRKQDSWVQIFGVHTHVYHQCPYPRRHGFCYVNR